MDMPKLEFYYFASCPFCIMVENEIKKYAIKVHYKDIFSNEKYRKKLILDTGKQTVPCLYIDGNPMHESSDIIKWLEENQDRLEKEERK